MKNVSDLRVIQKLTIFYFGVDVYNNSALGGLLACKPEKICFEKYVSF